MSMITPVVIEIGYKRSGYGAGEIDYAVNVECIDNMSKESLQNILQTLDEVKSCCTIENRKRELGL